MDNELHTLMHTFIVAINLLLFSVPHLSDSTTAHPAVWVKHLDSRWTFLCLKKMSNQQVLSILLPNFLGSVPLLSTFLTALSYKMLDSHPAYSNSIIKRLFFQLSPYKPPSKQITFPKFWREQNSIMSSKQNLQVLSISLSLVLSHSPRGQCELELYLLLISAHVSCMFCIRFYLEPLH